MTKRLLFSMILFIFSAHAVKSQSYYFRHYQVENGLSNNTVFCCVQDKRGFLWMGTKDGLNRFDGYSFKVFRNDINDTSSLGDNFIRSLLLDANDVLYAGTRNGLYRYNPLTEKFLTVYKSNSEVRDIKKDGKGNLWFVSGQTLLQYNEDVRKVRIYKPEDYFAATSICIDQRKTLWVSTAAGQLQKYDPDNDSFKSYNIFSPLQQSSSNWIERIYATSLNTLLVGTSNYGVKLFDLRDLTYKDLLTYNPDKTEIFARDFVQNSSTEFWMATESGIFIYNTVTEKFSNLKKKFTNPYSISDNAVYSLCKDKEGGIWAGTYFGGANYYPCQYTSFEKYFPDYGRSSISGNAVREICEDRYGNLWIGTEDAGLNKLDRQTGLFTQYKPSGKRTDISYPNIHGLLAKDDELWIGTFEHGLNIMDIKTGKVIKHYSGDNKSKVLKSNFIVTIYQTKKGYIFIGTRHGLYRFNPGDNSFINIESIPSYCFIHALMEDKNGLLWVGTMGNGLFYYDVNTNKSSNITAVPGNKEGISNNSITTIFDDAHGGMWLGTEGGGLCKSNEDGLFTNYSTKDGFPGNTIFKILEDSHQNLWITTSKGLVCFDPASKKIKVYTTANGLLSDQFNYNSGYKDASGKMYFGSVKGLISFNPDHFLTDTFTPPLFITSIQVNDKDLGAGTAPASLKQAVPYTRFVELAHNKSSFNIDFAALSFTAPEMTEYKYIMEGLDNDWTYLKSNRKVYFTNILPGTYTFKVKATNSSGVWSNRETSLLIKILPPVWASPLAYSLYLLLTVSLIYYLFKSYHNRVSDKNVQKIQLLEHEKEKELYHAKFNFFINVAHEIKTPLTLIKAPLERILQKAGDSVEIGPILKIMERNATRLFELTSQLLDFSRIETNGLQLNFIETNITELLVERFMSFKTIAEQKDIDLNIQVPREPVYACVDVDSMHKIFNNLFYNALNYGRFKVDVKLSPVNDKKQFRVTFSNDGNLVPATMKEKIFEPFYRLKETQDKPGNGIGLALSRSLVMLHKGELYLQPVNGINIFVLSLPVQQISSGNVN